MTAETKVNSGRPAGHGPQPFTNSNATPLTNRLLRLVQHVFAYELMLASSTRFEDEELHRQALRHRRELDAETSRGFLLTDAVLENYDVDVTGAASRARRPRQHEQRSDVAPGKWREGADSRLSHGTVNEGRDVSDRRPTRR